MSSPHAEHIIIVGIDGMGGYYINKKLNETADNKSAKVSETEAEEALEAICPTFDKLLKGKLEGFNTIVGTTTARTVFPPISSPAWGSILSGLTPDQTGMMNNDWPLANEEEQPLPVVASSHNKGIPRTIFDLVPNAKGDTKHFAAVSWSWLGRKMLSHLPNVNTIQCDGDDERVVREFLAVFGTGKDTAAALPLPKVAYLHFDDVDHAGHRNEWGSEAYYNSWRAQDEKLTRVLEAVKDKSCAIVVISDHGGSEKGHGDMKLSHMQIPIILSTTHSCPRVIPSSHAMAAHSQHPSVVLSAIDVVPTVLALQGVEKDELLRGKALAQYAA